MARLRIAIFVGTRPEAIKLAPLVINLRQRDSVSVTLVSTGQHREMLSRALNDFGLKPDVELDVMQPNQTLASLSSRLFAAIDTVLAAEPYDWVIVQGDTTTAMVASMCAFYRKQRIGHVEAGLRSHNMYEPFPEEFNRRVTGLIAGLHFAPTPRAAACLLNEGIPAEAVHVTGNTGIDALLMMAGQVRHSPPPMPDAVVSLRARHQRYVLITGHRRENFGQGFENICQAILTLARRHPETGFLYPVHLNPNVRAPVHALLAGQDNICLAEPLDYRGFVSLMAGCHFLLSDSGGVQEEAPSLGKPVLVMRDVTERPEGVDAGCAALVGASTERIVSIADELLNNSARYAHMAQARNPYGDGRASEMIATLLGADR